MRQIWTNCHLYNKKETPIDRAGRQAEELFQEKWNRSGFAAADARARRNNAGVAAPKFEPNEYGPPEKKLQRRSSWSKNGRTTAKKVRHPRACPAMRVCGLLTQTIGLLTQNASCDGLCTECIVQCCIICSWFSTDVMLTIMCSCMKLLVSGCYSAA